MCALHEVPLQPLFGPLPKVAWEFVEEGLRRGKHIDCFDFVPSNYAVVHAALCAVPPGRFCEWGSGMGIVTGLAEMLGFDAHGIEIDSALAAASRSLLADFGLSATIETGSYLEIVRAADVYFTYCWPGQIQRTERQFVSVAPDHARLLICHGAENVCCKVKRVLDDPRSLN